MVAIMAEHKKDTSTLARAYIESLCKGIFPNVRPDFGQWEQTIDNLETVFLKVERKGGDIPEAMAGVVQTLCKNDKDLAALLKPLTPIEVVDDCSYPELPEPVRHNAELAARACKWLDEYVAFSKYWSPRGYETYHEAIGLSLLSTVAGRRVSFPFGPRSQYTPFYIALLGDSTFFRKSTTTGIYQDLLHAAGLDWLFGANITTPQKLLSDMAGKTIPSNFDTLDPFEQERVTMRLAMPGQRGWFYDEFGLHLDQMMRETGVMSDFKGLLRLLDDCKPVFETATHARSLERIEKPYLSLLASMTPDDIKPHAQKDNKFWRDGLYARFCFVTPPNGAKYSRARFRNFGKPPTYPATLIQPLQRWHEGLGMAEIRIVSNMNKAGTDVIGHTIERVRELPEQVCTAGQEIEDALYTYEGALIDIAESGKIHKSLFANYGRLHILALRIAMLLASFDNNGKIELRHWARGQAFAEARRRDLHELFAQVNGSDSSDHDLMEQAIESYVKQQEVPCTASLIKQYCGSADVRKLTSKQITELCESMARAGLLKKEHPGQGQTAPRFSVAQN